MTCDEAIALLADFLDEALDEAALADLDRHLADCPPCVTYLATYRRTRELTGEAGHVEMPPEMKARLKAFLLKRLREDQR